MLNYSIKNTHKTMYARYILKKTAFQFTSVGQACTHVSAFQVQYTIATSFCPPDDGNFDAIHSSFAQNPPENNRLSCVVCQTCINWTVNGGPGGSDCVSSTNTSYLITTTAVQNAAYIVIVTYQAADGCEASNNITVLGKPKMILVHKHTITLISR